ncbi:hypothetical protein TNCV_4693261 [Trichonephila clavipes]|nr:hypothetical protein TNCV_4693261 [Trichonephila clavipes]
MYVKEGKDADREECCSLRCIRDEMYILSHKQQSMMNQVKIVKIRAFARSEPKDVSSDYVEQEASKSASFKLCMPNPAYTSFGIQGLETTGSAKPDHVGSSGGCYAEKWPDTVSPTYAPSVRCTG